MASFATLGYFGLDSREIFCTVWGVESSDQNFKLQNTTFQFQLIKTHGNGVYGHENESGWKTWKKAFDEFFMNSITTKPVGNKIRLNNDNYLGEAAFMWRMSSRKSVTRYSHLTVKLSRNFLLVWSIWLSFGKFEMLIHTLNCINGHEIVWQSQHEVHCSFLFIVKIILIV